MKPLSVAFLFLISLISSPINSQTITPDGFFIEFNDPRADLNRLFIDTVSNPNNIWQIGKTNKRTIITGNIRVLATDTSKDYPVNDTSHFIVTFIAGKKFISFGFLDFEYNYKVQADSLRDYGKLEFSINNGLTWINPYTVPVSDSVRAEYLGLETYTGTDLEKVQKWQTTGFTLLNGFSNKILLGDTILFRFSFVSDSISNLYDGWVIRDIYLEIDPHSVSEKQNPTAACHTTVLIQKDMLKIMHDENNSHNVQEFRLIGRNGEIILKSLMEYESSIELKAPHLKSGIYFWTISDKNQKYHCSKKLIYISQ
ncbi:MAG: hypothetical protein KDC83_05790 [Flavobacteriales bacterium]|nr:hypothetical protein [Flavobacteriales bacterium]